MVPSRAKQNSSIEDAVEIKNYTSELTVTGESILIEEPLSTLLKLGDGEVIASAVLRGATRIAPFTDLILRHNDIIMVEGPSTAIGCQPGVVARWPLSQGTGSGLHARR